jgi:hypothetical protein
MNGGTRHTTDRHPWLALLKVTWWVLAQPAVATGLAVIVAVRAAGAPAVAALAIGLILGLGVAAATVYRRHLGVAARLRRAMVEVGLVHREAGRPPVEPRRRGRAIHDGRNLVLRWEMPPGTTRRKIADHLEELEQRCGVGLVCWYEGARLHTEVLRHRLPQRVDFESFYRRSRPGGDLVVGLGASRRGWLWFDLAALPHLLVGGMSGGGKSVFLRQLLTWLVLAYQPASLRLLLLDFKSGVELIRFGRLPHALHPAVTDPEDAEFALRQVVAEIDRRMTAMAEAQVVDLDAWEAVGGAPMPRWVVVCDELSRLTIGNAGESKEQRGIRERTTALLCDIARLGRAAGVHLVVCIQRPDADAVPGQLKANLAGTVAFRVRNEANSRILLDCDRAALLPSHHGRAIWQDHQMEEFQAIYLDSDECFRLIEERWLREVDDFGATGGIRRWSPESRVRRSRPFTAPVGRIAAALRSAAGPTSAMLRSAASAVRTRGAGVGTPAADQGGGSVGARAHAPGTSHRPGASPAAAPSAASLIGRPTHDEALPDDPPAMRVVPMPTHEPGGTRLTECRQSTEDCWSSPEESV